MFEKDTVDMTIRNQRYRGWPHWLLLIGWALGWMPVAGLAERMTSPFTPERNIIIVPTTVVVMLASFVVMLILIDRRPIHRLKLGDEMRRMPSARYEPKDIVMVRFGHDPMEDYAEDKLPIRLCEATVEPRRGRTFHLTVSNGDAIRLREWAEHKGITVVDPEGYSRLLPSPVSVDRRDAAKEANS
jgi:hypothetical protein